MATGVLSQTRQADIALAITGHLGPGAPAEKDGLIFIAIVCNSENKRHEAQTKLATTERVERQHEAVAFALRSLLSFWTND